MAPKRLADLDDFIAPDNDNPNDNGAVGPAAKKQKRKNAEGGDVKNRPGKTQRERKKPKAQGKGAGNENATARRSKGKGEIEIGGGGKRDGKGEEFWEISGKRRVAISEYSGKTMVNVREYYEKNGEALPGKKGISLTLEQFNAVIELLPHIESVLVAKGETVSRPYYTEQTRPVGQEQEEEEEKEEEEEEEGEGEEEEDEDEDGRVGDRGKKKGKKNFEETSEEEEE